jgi:hypothetical protein
VFSCKLLSFLVLYELFFCCCFVGNNIFWG